jgi:hypothetical protein
MGPAVSEARPRCFDFGVHVATHRSYGNGPHSAQLAIDLVLIVTARMQPCLAEGMFRSPLFRGIERQVELQHVDPRFAEDAKHTALGILGNQLAHLVFR